LECKVVQSLWKAVWILLKKLKIKLPYDPVIPLLGISPKEHKSGHNRDTCVPDVHYSSIHNIQALETTQVPNWWNGSRNCDKYTQWSFTQP
jgi:hypothetical protein